MRKKPYGSRKKDITTVGDAIKELLNTYRIKSKYHQTNIKASWTEVMGNTIASRTDKIFFKNNVLFVQLNSAALKHELNMSKSKVLAMLQEKFGKTAVEEIVFM
jgi:predicted nucleic acid-binding Zn ribbon protein